MPTDLHDLIEGLALRRPPPRIAEVHRAVFTVAVEHGWAVPSYEVVRRIIRGLDRGLLALAHHDGDVYGDGFELVLRRQSAHPNDLWQADHTELDVMVLDEAGRPARPWLTVVEDDHSRAVAGRLHGVPGGSVGRANRAGVSSGDLAQDRLHRSRGRDAVKEFGVLPAFTGIAVHDALSVYDGADYLSATHALCGAHISRELVAAAGTHPEQAWPQAALDALHGLNHAAHDARAAEYEQISRKISGRLYKHWRPSILCGLADHPRREDRKQSKTRNLLERLHNRDEQVLRFARDPSVPFTNDQAERDLRPVKTQMKISGCTRSETSARAWLRVRGYISTARKNHVNALDALRDAITGNPWEPSTISMA